MKTSMTHKILLLAACMTVFGASAGFAQDRPRSSAPEARKIVPTPRDIVKVDLWFDKECGSAYRQGEKIIINFKTNVDSYITLYDIDTRGQVSVLFPNKNQPDNFVRGGQTYVVPDRTYSYDLVVEGPEGIEYVDGVSSTDPYYHWNYHQGEPRWVRDWGLKGRNFTNTASANYKSSPEYRNRPNEFGDTGEQSLARNIGRSRALREDIRSKLVVTPRVSEKPRAEQTTMDYGTATCYFYVTAARPVQPTQPLPTREEYLWQQQQEFQQIPGFDVRQSGQQLIVTMPGTVLFDTDSYALRYEARRDLDKVADILLRYPETSITVAGHTDSVGDAGYNQRLSEYRAKSVADYLLSRGVQSLRIGLVGYGETMPVASNSSESGRQRNRRVELDIRVNQQYGY